MKFSVIVPVYNVKPYLRACLDSVLAQTCADWECVCVDDGSTDGCAEVLDEYAKKNVRFRVIHKKNEGVAIARNTALDIIQGEWFLFLDSDDVWAPNLLEVCEAGMRFDESAAIIAFQDRHFGEHQICDWAGVDGDPHFSKLDMSGPFSRRWMGFVAPKKAYRRLVFGDLREKPYVVGEDLLYMTECALRIDHMVTTPLRVYGYRDRMSSVTRTRPSERKVCDHILFTQDIVALLEKSGRNIAQQTRKELCNVLTEDIADEYAQLDLDERGRIKAVWLAALRALLASGIPYGMQRVRLHLMTGSLNLTWRIAALSPRRIKAMGVRR